MVTRSQTNRLTDGGNKDAQPVVGKDKQPMISEPVAKNNEKDPEQVPGDSSTGSSQNDSPNPKVMEAFLKTHPGVMTLFQGFEKNFQLLDDRERQGFNELLMSRGREQELGTNPRGVRGQLQKELPFNQTVSHARGGMPWVGTVEKQLQELLGSVDGNEESISPFIPSIRDSIIPYKFKLPDLKLFEGNSDPMVFLQDYIAAMSLRNAPADFMCKAFPTYLTGHAKLWFGTLPRGSIHSFRELGTIFHTRFFQGKKIRKTITELMALKQRKDESLGSFYSRFTKEQIQVEGISEEMIIATFTNGLDVYGPSVALRQKLMKKPPRNLQQLFQTVETEVQCEEALRRAKEGQSSTEKRFFDNTVKGRTEERQDRGKRKLDDRYTSRSRNESLQIHEGRDGLVSSKEAWCNFHKRHGHDTSDCKARVEKMEPQKVEPSHTRGDDTPRGNPPEDTIW